jgi:hypothetical protein
MRNKNKPGRPKTTDRDIHIRISNHDRNYLKEIGRGSVTNGLRWLLKLQRQLGHKKGECK